MLDAGYRDDAGKISALYILDMLQNDALFFSDGDLVYADGVHRVQGLQIDRKKAEAFPDAVGDVQNFSRAVRDFVAYAENNPRLRADASELGEGAARFTGGEPVTAATIAKLFTYNAVKLTRSEGVYAVVADPALAAAFPRLDRLMTQLVATALAYNGAASAPPVAYSVAAVGGAAYPPQLERSLVFAAAPALRPVSLAEMETFDGALGAYADAEKKAAAAALCARGVLIASGDYFTLNRENPETAAFLERRSALDAVEEQRPKMREAVLQSMREIFAQLNAALSDYAAELTGRSNHLTDVAADIARLEGDYDALDKTRRRRSGAGRITFAVLLFIVAGFLLTFAAMRYFNLEDMLPEAPFGLDARTLILGEAALAVFFILVAALMLGAMGRAAKKLVPLDEELDALYYDYDNLSAAVESLRVKKKACARYIVMISTVVTDMENGDYAGADLIEKALPGQMEAIAGGALSCEADLLILLSHCGACTADELSVITGRGRDEIDASLASLRAAGRVVSWVESGEPQFCVRA